MVEIDLSAARALQPTAKLGDLVESRSTPRTLGASQRRPPSRITQRIKGPSATVYAEFEAAS